MIVNITEDLANQGAIAFDHPPLQLLYRALVLRFEFVKPKNHCKYQFEKELVFPTSTVANVIGSR